MSQPEILFYHLTHRSLEDVLPRLLAKVLERDQRCVIEGRDEERLKALDAHLWAFDEESFLPHAFDTDPDIAEEPICLTQSSHNPNNAEVRFLIDRADVQLQTSHQRLVLIFDARDDEALTHAREQWKGLKAKGLTATYWQEDESGRFVQKG